ncbi:MAG: tape measure protein [Gammaproteobacteria bacterium]|nr:tape measure protein [Gammaproteobacteria bacterium]
MSSKSFSLKAVLSAVDRVSGPLKRINRGLRRNRKAWGDVGKTGSDVLGRIRGMLGPGGALLGAGGLAGVALGVRKVINTSAEFERLQAVLETVEGSGAKARESLKWVQGFSESTPYQLNEVSEAFVRLRTYGVDAMDGSLRAAGDAAAAMGKPIMQAVEAMADALTGENERLKEFGIKASVAGDQITYSWSENGKTMVAIADKNNRALIQKTIAGIWNRRYGGAMDKLSSTWSGIWSNIQDAQARFFLAIGEAGAFDFLKGELKSLLDTIKRMQADGSLQALAKTISDELVGAFKQLKAWMMSVDWGAVWSDIKEFGAGLSWVAEKLGGTKGVLIALGAILAGPLLLALTQFGWSALMAGKVVIGSLLPALGSILAMGARFVAFWGVMAMANPMSLVVVAAVAAIAGAVYLIYDNWEGVTKWFTDKLNAVKSAFKEGFLQGLGKLIQEFNPFTILLESLDGLINAVADLDLGAMLKEKVKGMTDILPSWLGGDDEEPSSVGRPPGGNALSAARAKAELNGDLVVRFENAPPGMRVAPGTTNQSGVSLNPDVGYRSMAWVMP